jgi:hypothetical protein
MNDDVIAKVNKFEAMRQPFEPISTTTNEEMNITIAEACGYQRWKSVSGIVRLARPDAKVAEYWQRCGDMLTTEELTKGFSVRIPDYINDTNDAMQLTKVLAQQGWRCVANMGLDGTWEIISTRFGQNHSIPWDGDHYGAGDTLSEAICEMFLRTIGKWKDK